MKLSDFVARFLARQGIRHVFAITGGASVHLIQSIADTPGIDFICPQHEQAGAMAADAYSRATGNLGAAISTSGPGATNMLTGVCCAYYDSIPVIYITGQVFSSRSKADTGVRQMGFQETDTVEIYRPVTKYAVRVDDPREIQFELEKAVYLAKSGRPGPVLIDIPDDVQRAEIDPKKLPGFLIACERVELSCLNRQVTRCIELINQAKRPVIILGWGIRLAKAEEEIKELLHKLQFPVALTWAVMDMFSSRYMLLVGGFGTHGTRHGNFAVQNADLILAIGTRLDIHQRGSPPSSFARGAKKIVVDIDPAELGKFGGLGIEVDLSIRSDAGAFLRALNRRSDEISSRDISDWKIKINDWKKKFPICSFEYYDEKGINPYIFVRQLSEQLTGDDTIIVDTGCALAWTMQAFRFKAGQRLFHDFNNTAMGYALPASIGACFALGRKRVICITGDGSLQMNIQELATVIRHRLPIKIFVVNNQGYSMVRQTQDQWLGSRYLASSVEGGLAFPDFAKVARVYGFKVEMAERSIELISSICQTLDGNYPALCDVRIPSEYRTIPQAKFGRPIEDNEPLLDREEFLENMIVKPVDVSLKGGKNERDKV